MAHAPTSKTDARPNDSERDGVLNDIAIRWSRFSRRDLLALKTNDELIAHIVAKYGIEEKAVRRDVDALMDGRDLA